MPRTRFALLPWLLLLGAAACDNVGRAFDPVIGPDDPTPTSGPSPIQEVPVGGDVRDGRPKVKAAFPSGGGWPTVVPIVIEFNESINEAFIEPSTPTGSDGRVILRVRGTTQVLPCQYNFVANGRVLVMRPVTALSNAAAPTYEVVLLPESRDVDGIRFQVAEGGVVLTDFQVNQDPSFTDGRILTTFPRDNARDATRETEYFCVFDRPANSATVLDSNFRVLLSGGADVAGARDFPLEILGIDDPRVVRFTPDTPLLATTDYEFVVDETITFGQEGVLDFRGRTPFAEFTTIGPAAPVSVVVGNPSPGFPNKINRSNAATVRLDVVTPVDTLPGDRVLARIYGEDATTAATGDLNFVERAVAAAVAGTQTVTVDFTGTLGTLDRPQFEDWDITLAVQMQRGSEHSGFAQHDEDDEPAFDITLPTMLRAGPPGSADGLDIFTELESVSFFGTASEPIGAALLTDGGPEVALFASGDDSQFLMTPPARFGRLPTPRTYSLTLTDEAGNMAPGAASGRIVQRGLITGVVVDNLTVEVYDEVTLLPIASATVIVDPGVPTVPADVDQQVLATGADGRAIFTVSAEPHTITVVRPGFHLLTVQATTAAFASLPLRPVSGATATLQGNTPFIGAPGATVLVGTTSFDDRTSLAVQTTSTAATVIPPTPIVPNRPAIVSAFGGLFEPTGAPTFSLQAFQVLAVSQASPTPTPTAPPIPPAAGDVSNVTLPMIPSTGGLTSLTTSYTEDFGAAVGLDLANLVGGEPTVRVTQTLLGFGGQALIGVGWTVPGTGTEFIIDANYSLLATTLVPFNLGLGWVVAEARDQAGRVSRHRRSLQPSGSLLDFFDPAPIPVITDPVGPVTGSPAVTFVDGLAPASGPGGVGTIDVTAEDTAGRRWVVLVGDADAAGGTDTVQFPDLTNTGVSGLQVGTWNVRAEARVWFTTSATNDDMVLAERFHTEVLYAKSLPVPFVIQ